MIKTALLKIIIATLILFIYGCEKHYTGTLAITINNKSYSYVFDESEKQKKDALTKDDEIYELQISQTKFIQESNNGYLENDTVFNYAVVTFNKTKESIDRIYMRGAPTIKSQVNFLKYELDTNNGLCYSANNFNQKLISKNNNSFNISIDGNIELRDDNQNTLGNYKIRNCTVKINGI
ncbi:hypothetical protein LBMAG27_25170 [Bacteroidota bacterium]|nr:hypothetical protein LBMAG27_25170 [Bacteroidota bacterium]